jgi:hypothetical protein
MIRAGRRQACLPADVLKPGKRQSNARMTTREKAHTSADRQALLVELHATAEAFAGRLRALLARLPGEKEPAP